MKKRHIAIGACVLACWGMGPVAGAEIIYQNDCTSLSTATFEPYVYAGTPSVVANVSQGTSDIKTDAWSGSVANLAFVFDHTIEANTKYVATIQLQQWGGGGYTAQDMKIGMSARNVPGAWESFASDTVTPQLAPGNAPGAYSTHVIEFDTAVETGAVGKTQMYVQFEEVYAWSQIAIGDIQVEAIPEPATLGLIGLASVALLVVRRFRI